MLRRILVAYDGSPPARRAFDFALDLAVKYQATVAVVSVARPPEPPTRVETEAMLEDATEHYEKDFEALRAAAARLGVPLTTQVVVGHPADQIVHQATEQGTDLIVMGHRGKSLIQRWLLGSVSKRVISYAGCSVVIVR
jgi:nucleotide-binding universal stress UspA family protein